jgi:hypothetical protein
MAAQTERMAGGHFAEPLTSFRPASAGEVPAPLTES